MIPRPPGRASNRRAGQGLTMSKARKHRNAAAIQGQVLGNSRQVTHSPMNSSQTARLGSFSSSVTSRPVAHIPKGNPTRIIRYNQGESPDMGRSRYMPRATRLPAVPGATGERPEPKPVPTNQPRRSSQDCTGPQECLGPLRCLPIPHTMQVSFTHSQAVPNFVDQGNPNFSGGLFLGGAATEDGLSVDDNAVR